ncbi:hypothetical protein V6248_08060 [Pseudoalteromonas agarivorans]|uniref:hypothetical protein n=1 Tax=Pseudoalteromonas agarivorans TaxID=176102 RepID=UPI00311F6A4B
MKNLLKKLGSPSAFCHYKYHLTTDKVVSQTEKNKPRLTLATACTIDRNLFWATTRTYENTSITEIKNIIQAEKIQLPPMEGGFFWSIEALSSNQFTISYFVIPEFILDLVPQECRVIIPIYSIEEETNIQPLCIAHSGERLNQTDEFDKLNWLNLLGLFFTRKEKKVKQEKLNNRKLIILLCSLFGVTALSLSVYFTVAINHYQNQKIQNESPVNAVLSQRQVRTKELKLTADLIEFLDSNPNVLDKLSQIKIEGEGVFLTRVNLIPKGVELVGTSANSATKILEEIMDSEAVKEAKFSRAVTKNKAGSEFFTIEVTWK